MGAGVANPIPSALSTLSAVMTPRSVQLGNLTLDLVSDGTFLLDAGSLFGVVPRKLWSRFVTSDADNCLRLSLNCLLIRGGRHTILVDTGLGAKLSERQRRFWSLERHGDLLDRLGLLGVAPEGVDLVVNSHLHADHCGWNTRPGPAGPVPTFPNAVYLVQRAEWDAALTPDERTRATYLPENYEPLQATGQLRLVEGDTTVERGIRCLLTGGHSAGHQVVALSSRRQEALLLCDLVQFGLNLERPAWISAFDVLPLETLEQKRRLVERALRRRALLFLGHEPDRPWGRLRRGLTGVRYMPEEAT